MSVVCASRIFEAEHLYPLNNQEWSSRILIESPSEEFVDRIFKKLNFDRSTLSPRLLSFLNIPINLRLASEIIKKGGNPKSITTLHGLYEKLFELFEVSPGELTLLIGLAELMLKAKSTYLPYSIVGQELLGHIKNIERPGITGILQIDETISKVSFTHQTLIDYLLAINIVKNNQSIKDFVFKHNQSLFVRPVIKHALGIIRTASPSRLITELSSLFLDKPQKESIGFAHDSLFVNAHIKNAVLADMASWNQPTDVEGTFLLRLFSEPTDAQNNLVQFFDHSPKVDWFYKINESYIAPILDSKDDSSLEFRLAINYLASISQQIPDDSLNIANKLLEKEYNQMIEWYIRRLADELSKVVLDNKIQEKYVGVLEKAVKRNFIKWYYEIKIISNKISKYFPSKALDLYLDSISIELKKLKRDIVLSQGSLTTSFDEVLPGIYEHIPFELLDRITDFFEDIISSTYEGDNRLYDHPAQLLYSVHPDRFGLDAFYFWYKNKMLEFTSKLSESTRSLIRKLEQSTWESQKQLSILCKLNHSKDYSSTITDFIKSIIQSDFSDDMYVKSELFLFTIDRAFKILDSSEQNHIIDKLLSIDIDDKDKAHTWVWKPLNHLPSDAKSAKVTQKLADLKSQYPWAREYKYRPPIKSSGAHWTTSPISKEKLSTKSLDELYKYLIDSRNLKSTWDSDTDVFLGGIRELALEVALLFVENQDKYSSIIDKLAVDPDNDEYLVCFFLKLSEKEAKVNNIQWTINLIKKTYKRTSLQLEILRYLRKMADNMTSNQLNEIQNILPFFADSADPSDYFIEARKQGYGNDPLTEGINSVRGLLVEVVVVFLRKVQTALLNELLVKLSIDKSISVRAVVIYSLPFLIEALGWEKTLDLFRNAFNAGKEEYSNLVTRYLQYIPKEDFSSISDILKDIESSKSTKLGEAHVVLHATFFLRGFVIEDDLLKVICDDEINFENKQKGINLIANHVRFEEMVDKCISVISKTLNAGVGTDENLNILILNARPDDFGKFYAIIEDIVKRKEIRGSSLHAILEYLEKCLLVDPQGVFDLVKTVLSNADDDFYNVSDFVPASHSKAPLNIINTILECFPEKESEALSALDTLIKLNWTGIKEYLFSLDRL